MNESDKTPESNEYRGRSKLSGVTDDGHTVADSPPTCSDARHRCEPESYVLFSLWDCHLAVAREDVLGAPSPPSHPPTRQLTPAPAPAPTTNHQRPAGSLTAELSTSKPSNSADTHCHARNAQIHARAPRWPKQKRCWRRSMRLSACWSIWSCLSRCWSANFPSSSSAPGVRLPSTKPTRLWQRARAMTRAAKHRPAFRSRHTKRAGACPKWLPMI